MPERGRGDEAASTAGPADFAVRLVRLSRETLDDLQRGDVPPVQRAAVLDALARELCDALEQAIGLRAHAIAEQEVA